jgi:hypothetical protein
MGAKKGAASMINEKTKPDTSDLVYTEGQILQVDWRELTGENCDGFRYGEEVCRSAVAEALDIPDAVLEAAELPESLCAINGIVDLYQYEEAIEDACDDAGVDMPFGLNCEMESCQGPMMNFVHTLPDFRGELEDAARLEGNMCLVEFSPENQDKGLPAFGLALCGGGMDMSWDIAGCYVDLGFRPPATVVSRLPKFAGDKLTPRKAKIIQAMQEEAERRILWAQNDIKRLDDILARLEENTP